MRIPCSTGAEVTSVVSNVKSQPSVSAAAASVTIFMFDAGIISFVAFRL